ncbi:hypothetical protein [Burkholderia cenocepacia]|uniref:hypothetical protein n=1 Tax=Burkholderia cenocepacia TaxID=95486 RepID=UPI000761D515|nr:hypothetical protein [Burkholderia cenocepacia]KWU26342.1 hypothetical protein AS149_25470 [Burkholderia cenocepacia]
MTRPAEYENLIKTNALEPVSPTAGAIDVYLKNAANYQTIAEHIEAGPDLALQKFTMAYEGYFQLVQAILEFYEVRSKDSGRNLIIQRVSSSLGVSSAEYTFITRAHERRNSTSYRSPFPPVSETEAATMLSILAKYLPIARTFTSTSATP